jgi:hypothetical protein
MSIKRATVKKWAMPAVRLLAHSRTIAQKQK